MSYSDWIAGYRAKGPTLGMCSSATKEMLGAFPELTRVRGWVHDAFVGRREHWWLTAPDGSVVDPTVDQFPGVYEYEPLDEANPPPLRSGSCMDCGASVFDGATFCDAECEAATAEYLGLNQGGAR